MRYLVKGKLVESLWLLVFSSSLGCHQDVKDDLVMSADTPMAEPVNIITLETCDHLVDST